MEPHHVDGTDRGKLFMYALSTCVWCKKTKAFLDSLGVGYDYVYVDTLAGEEKEKSMEEIKRFNPQCSFPTLIINGKTCVVGYNENKIREALGL